MAWFPVVASVVGTVLQMQGQRQAADAARQQGLRQQEEANFKAAQMDQQAQQERAAAQMKAQEETRRAGLVASRATAVAGASGGDLSDPSIVNLIADIQGEGAYRSGVQLYQGEENARQLRMGAGAQRYTGYVDAQGGYDKGTAYDRAGASAAFNGASTIYNKFGFGGPSTKDAISGNGSWLDAGTPSTMMG